MFPLVSVRLLPICFRKFSVGVADMAASLTKRVLDAALPREREYFIWCDALPGFGARIYPETKAGAARKIFVAQVRVGRSQRRVKIGAFGPYTVEKARERAGAIIRAAAEGRDPQREKQQEREAI